MIGPYPSQPCVRSDSFRGASSHVCSSSGHRRHVHRHMCAARPNPLSAASHRALASCALLPPHPSKTCGRNPATCVAVTGWRCRPAPGGGGCPPRHTLPQRSLPWNARPPPGLRSPPLRMFWEQKSQGGSDRSWPLLLPSNTASGRSAISVLIDSRHAAGNCLVVRHAPLLPASQRGHSPAQTSSPHSRNDRAVCSEDRSRESA